MHPLSWGRGTNGKDPIKLRICWHRKLIINNISTTFIKFTFIKEKRKQDQLLSLQIWSMLVHVSSIKRFSFTNRFVFRHVNQLQPSEFLIFKIYYNLEVFSKLDFLLPFYYFLELFIFCGVFVYLGVNLVVKKQQLLFSARELFAILSK